MAFWMSKIPHKKNYHWHEVVVSGLTRGDVLGQGIVFREIGIVGKILLALPTENDGAGST